MTKLVILVPSAICCAALVLLAAVAMVALATSSSSPEADDMMSDATVTSRPADFFGIDQGFYAYNLLDRELEDLTSEDTVLRCWGQTEEIAERYAYGGVEIETITEGPDKGTYCKDVSAEELLS